jgi:hypothetical protein
MCFLPPNSPFHLTAARVRSGVHPKGYAWAASGPGRGAVDYLLQPYLPGVNSTPILHRLVNRHCVPRERGYFSLHPVDRSYALARVPRGVEETPTAPVSGRYRPGAMSPPE